MNSTSTPVRILQVTGGMNRGGAETMIMNIYREIDRDKVQFDFISYSDSQGDYDVEINKLGGRVIRIPSPKNSGFYEYLNNIRRINSQYGPYKAIHTHTLFNSGIPLLCARIIGIPRRVCHAHSTSTSDESSISYKIYSLFMRLLISVSSTTKIACSTDAGNYLYGDSFKKEGIIIPNAINIEQFFSFKKEKLKYNRRSLAQDNELLIGSVGSFRKAKNHTFMIDIAEEMKKEKIPFKLVFVGQGPYLDKIKKLVDIKKLENEVIFLGLRDDVSMLMDIFDVLLMPSFYEGFPVTLVESQSSRIASVISDNISQEVDFDLGLVKRLSLDESKNIWIQALLQGARLKNTVPEKIVYNRLYERGFLTKNSVQTLMGIYKIT